MAGVEVGDFGSPDETRAPDKTTIEVVRMGTANASRMRLEPGWRWSECVKPIVGGERCQAHHVGLLQSGTMHVVHDDGTEQEIRAGQAYVIEPGHPRGCNRWQSVANRIGAESAKSSENHCGGLRPVAGSVPW
jgi:hypothetical protein